MSAPTDDSTGVASAPAARSSQRAISCRHPRGVKPKGNQWIEGKASIRGPGLGWLGGCFTDVHLLDFLRGFLPACALVSLSRASKALYIVANEEDIWRERVLERWEGAFRFKKDWKNTYASMERRERWSAANPHAPPASAPQFPLLPAPLRFDGYYSDELFQSFYCAHIDLMSCFGPDSGVQANIPRVHVRDLSPQRFREEFGTPNMPVIITGMMDQWPCFGKGDNKETAWNQENWLHKYSDTEFAIGRYQMRLEEYFTYMNGIDSDESPLYLFDSKFGDKIPELLDQYSVPEYFSHDLFDLLADGTPEGDKVRPSFRWILVGPARSGSTYHKDPNHTSAWNALISGEKLWIMYPPHDVPPGVFPSDDDADVTTPISVAEWFINYYDEHRTRVEEYEDKKKEMERKQAEAEKQQPPAKKVKLSATAASATSSPPPPSAASSLQGPVEALCHPGDIIFIPNGWVSKVPGAACLGSPIVPPL